MVTYWENSCSFGLRYVSWYKYLIVSLFFPTSVFKKILCCWRLMYVFIFLVKVTEWSPIGKIAAHSAYDMFHGIST